MRAIGLITEYNPFHNGHAYHVKQARICSGAEVVVAVMGGIFSSVANRHWWINGNVRVWR